MRIIAIATVSFTPDDRIASTTVLPLLTGEWSDFYRFSLWTTSIHISHHLLCRSCRKRGGEMIIGILIDETCCWSLIATTCPSTSTDDSHPTNYISSHTSKFWCEPGTEGVSHNIYLRSIYTIIISDITNNHIKECHIFLFSPWSRSSSCIDTSRIGNYKVTLTSSSSSLESHIPTNHSIAIGPSVDSDDESYALVTSVSWGNRENIGSIFPIDRNSIGSREITRLATSTRKILKWIFVGIIFSDSEDEFTRFSTRKRSWERVACTVENIVCFCEFSISSIPWSCYWGSDSIESESYCKSLENRDWFVRTECPIVKSFYYLESYSFTDIGMIPLSYVHIFETASIRALYISLNSLGKKKYFEYFCSRDCFFWSKCSIFKTWNYSFISEFLYRVTIEWVLYIWKWSRDNLSHIEDTEYQWNYSYTHRKKLCWESILFFCFLPNIFSENSQKDTFYWLGHRDKMDNFWHCRDSFPDFKKREWEIYTFGASCEVNEKVNPTDEMGCNYIQMNLMNYLR